MADVQNSAGLLSAFHRFERHKNLAGAFIAALIFTIGIFVLHRLATEISWHAVKSDISGLPWSTLAVSLIFTAVSYIAFSFYDVLALQRAVPGKVPVRVAMMAGAAGYAVSNLLGFSYITGPAVRSRIYSAYRVDLAVIAGIIASIWFFFWVGVMLLIAAMLLMHPTGIPALEDLSPLLQTSIALVILAMVAGLLFALSRGMRSLTFRSISIPLPGFRPAIMQIGIGMIDIAASAIALYVLLPGDIVTTFPLFFVVYVGAIALGIVSHSPGGLGVFEATIIAGLGATGRSDVLAALVLYRVIYYVLPFAIAAFSLGIAWIYTNRKTVGRVGQQARVTIGAIIPAIASAMTMIAGLMLLLSGNLPGEANRLTTLQSIVPLPVIEVSHLLASIIGVMLIVLARGLYRKQFKAWIFAVGFACQGG